MLQNSNSNPVIFSCGCTCAFIFCGVMQMENQNRELADENMFLHDEIERLRSILDHYLSNSSSGRKVCVHSECSADVLLTSSLVLFPVYFFVEKLIVIGGLLTFFVFLLNDFVFLFIFSFVFDDLMLQVGHQNGHPFCEKSYKSHVYILLLG